MVIKMVCAFVMPYSLLMLFRAPLKLKIREVQGRTIVNKVITDWLWTIVISDGVALAAAVLFDQTGERSFAILAFATGFILSIVLFIPGLIALTQAYGSGSRNS